ncbi:Uncharacterised protein [Mycobacteroides abscessus subsp. abscessus]|nr:Uncharacterised protein [Mycobacteroides abscessus subsp. abscessus]
MTCLDLLGRRERLVGLTRVEELLDDVLVDAATLRLSIRRVRAPDLRALVPVEPEPAEGLEDGVVGFLAVARGVGVFDPEDEGALVMTRLGEVEQRGPHHSDVRCARRRRTETDTDSLRAAHGGQRIEWVPTADRLLSRGGDRGSRPAVDSPRPAARDIRNARPSRPAHTPLSGSRRPLHERARQEAVCRR